MTKDKQIEDRRDISDIIYWSGYGFDKGTCNDIAKQIQEQGYRKASDVAREIFEEIEGIMAYFPIYGHSNTAILNEDDFAELKKKYESEGNK